MPLDKPAIDFLVQGGASLVGAFVGAGAAFLLERGSRRTSDRARQTGALRRALFVLSQQRVYLIGLQDSLATIPHHDENRHHKYVPPVSPLPTVTLDATEIGFLLDTTGGGQPFNDTVFADYTFAQVGAVLEVRAGVVQELSGIGPVITFGVERFSAMVRGSAIAGRLGDAIKALDGSVEQALVANASADASLRAFATLKFRREPMQTYEWPTRNAVAPVPPDPDGIQQS